MWRMLEQLNITYKKTLHPSEKETDRVQLLRSEFGEQIRDIPLKDLIFLDESGVNLAFIRQYLA
jgi:hypothetical protein